MFHWANFLFYFLRSMHYVYVGIQSLNQINVASLNLVLPVRPLLLLTTIGILQTCVSLES